MRLLLRVIRALAVPAAGGLAVAALVSGCSNSRGNVPAAPAATPVAQTRTAFLAQQLDELKTLPVPAGVKAITWAEMKTRLGEMLRTQLQANSSQPARSGSAAPVSDGARASLRFDHSAGLYSWELYNPGDYDQNGEVNISDLTPLALHLGETIPFSLDMADSIQAVVDGDGNGEINIADLTPIGANLGRRITGFNLYGTDGTDFPDTNGAPSTAQPQASVALAAYQGSRAAERVRYLLAGTFVPGTYYWLRPVDAGDSKEGTPSNELDGFTLLPEAKFTATPIDVATGAQVQFDATASINPVTGELQYFWDPEGDGTFTPGNHLLTFTYDTAGIYSPALRVVDTDNLADSTSIALNVNSAFSWHISVVESDDLTALRGLGCGVHDALPYVIYAYHSAQYDDETWACRIGKSNTGSAWGDPDYFETSGGTFSNQADVADTAGLPAVVFNYAGGELDFIGVGSPFGQPGVGPITLDSGSALGTAWPSLANINGLPAVAYYNASSQDLHYIPALNPEADVWGPIQTPVAATQLGECASLAQVNGAPAIAYFDRGAGRVRYVDSSISGGNVVWNPAVTAGATPDGIFFDSLVALADGSPAVAWHDRTFSRLMFTRAPGPAGNSFDPPIVIAGTGGEAKLIPHLTMVGSLPNIVWCDPTLNELMQSRAETAAALVWTAPSLVDDSVNANVIPALTTIGVHPGIAYGHRNPLQIRFAVFY